MIDLKTLKTLEFSKILTQLAVFASSSSAKHDVLNIQPCFDIKVINEMLNEVEEADKILFHHSVNPSFGFDDITVAIEKANVLSVLSMGELLKICRMLKVARNLQVNIVKVPDESISLLKDKASMIFSDKILEEDIDKAIFSENEMSDNASSELKSIRQKIRKIGDVIKAKLHHFISSPTYKTYLQDNIVTVRGDRYVIPVKVECKGQIPGLIHDQSASGQTIYVEPMVIVELNNDLKQHLILENQEIEKILRDFTFRVSGNVEHLRQSFEIITDLDVIFAKAMYANQNKSRRPIMNNKGYINIIKGRHPLIDSKKVVPTSIKIGDAFDMLFITGPNTGGKTVALKLTGLFVLMAMSGMFLPCSEAEIAVLDNVFCDIGDEQSIEQNLSTFSSHIANIVRVLSGITSNSLLLFDELGAGTDPSEGASLAVAISDFIKNTGAKAVITTHYNELKEYAVATARAENACMDFDPSTYSPTYKLIIGTPGASNALLIAEKLGMPKTIIEFAKSGIKTDKVQFENVMTVLEQARRNAVVNEEETFKIKEEAEKFLKEVKAEKQRLFEQRDKINDSVKRETKRLVEEAVSDSNEIIDKLKEMLNDPTEENLFTAHKLRKSLKSYIIDEDNEFYAFGDTVEGEIKVKDKVLIKSLNSEGIVLNVNKIKNEAKVKMGTLISNIKLSNLQKLKMSLSDIPEQPKLKSLYKMTTSAPIMELNIIGKNVDEGILVLEEFIDQALRGRLNEIRIIHGKGTGTLRRGVQDFLKQHKNIKTFRDGVYGEGERGVTIAELK